MKIFLQYVLPSIIGLFAGILTAQKNWKIEINKDKRERRKQLVNESRDWINTLNWDNFIAFSDSDLLFRISRFLDKELIDEIEFTAVLIKGYEIDSTKKKLDLFLTDVVLPESYPDKNIKSILSELSEESKKNDASNQIYENINSNISQMKRIIRSQISDLELNWKLI